MQYFQILSCNSDLSNCCNDYGIVTILDIIGRIFDIIQIVVPILLLVMVTVQLTKLVTNPDEKNGLKKLRNMVIAAVMCFLLPIITDAVMRMLPVSEDFQLSACWKQAKVLSEISRSSKNTYIASENVEKKSILVNPDDYEVNQDPGSVGNGNSTVTGEAIVNYAKQFVGQAYLWGGDWNGELPYRPTDCSGFVQGVFRHFGIQLKGWTGGQWNDTASYTLVSENDIRAGDLIMYDGHVGILTGNGPEIVHAKGQLAGVVIDPDYRKCSSHAIKGIMRIKGV